MVATSGVSGTQISQYNSLQFSIGTIEVVETIEIIGLECEVYCSHNHGIVNMCGGNMAAQ